MHQNIIGIFWSGLGKLGTKGVAFGFSIFLARLLQPEDFGLCGMVALFVAVAALFADSGFSAALVRKVTRTNRDYSTVFWFQLATSLLCYVVLASCSPLIAWFLGRPELVGIMLLVAANVVLGAMASVPYTRLRVSGRFRMISCIDVLAAILSGSVGLFLALFSLGVWAVVWQGVAWNISRAIMLFVAARWLPSWEFSRESFHEFFAFGWKQLLASLVNTTYSNIHALLIGRSFGAAETGLYNRAHYYTHEPGWLVQGTFAEVVYPALAEVQSDEKELRKRFLKAIGAEAVVMFAGLGVFAIFATEIVEFLVGTRWIPCVPYIQILALGAALEPLRAFMLMPFYVNGRTDLVLKLEGVETVIGLGLVFWALPFGVWAVCWAKTAYHLIGFIINGVLAWKRFN